MVTTDAAGRRRIVFAYRDGRPPVVRPPRPAPVSRIPATARGVAARFGVPPPVPGAAPPPGPPPPPEVCRALRERTGLSQRAAAEGAAVSRGLVASLEAARRRTHGARPHGQRREGRPVGSVEAERYVAWLRAQAAAGVA